MHHTNYFYGHAHLLARYVGLPDWRQPPRIWGYLQHGWNVHHGFDPRAELVPGVPKLVWSEGPVAKGHELGLRDYHVVGAPWSYLLAMYPADDKDDGSRQGTIVYPFHGWEQQPVTGDHHRLAQTIKEHESGPVTVCLYWLEYQAAEVRRSYERAGFRVITHGTRGRGRHDSNVHFLYRQLRELRRHRRVVSNRLSTAVLYGASVGCEVGVYGDPMDLAADEIVPGGAERIRSDWAELHGHTVPTDVAAKVARQELGLDHRHDPGRLAELFGWRQERDERTGRIFVAMGQSAERDELGELRAQLRWLDRAVQDRDRELQRVRNSASYRVGNRLVRPAGAVWRRLFKKGAGG